MINNRRYYDRPEREGSETDQREIAALFEELEFAVTLCTDLTAVDIHRNLQGIAERDHSTHDVFVLIIISHGGVGDTVYGVDDKSLTIQDLMNPFNEANCPTLKNKPKLFFIQACRGHGFDHPEEKTYNGICPIEADFLLAHSTVPGAVSFRHKLHGSLFIQVSLTCNRLFSEFQ